MEAGCRDLFFRVRDGLIHEQFHQSVGMVAATQRQTTMNINPVIYCCTLLAFNDFQERVLSQVANAEPFHVSHVAANVHLFIGTND